MNDTERIAQIRARVEAATGGPWHYTGVPEIPRVRTGAISHGCAGLLIAECKNDWFSDVEQAANAEFIAAAHEDIPWLLAQLAQERARAERTEALLRDASESLKCVRSWSGLSPLRDPPLILRDSLADHFWSWAEGWDCDLELRIDAALARGTAEEVDDEP